MELNALDLASHFAPTLTCRPVSSLQSLDCGRGSGLLDRFLAVSDRSDRRCLCYRRRVPFLDEKKNLGVLSNTLNRLGIPADTFSPCIRTRSERDLFADLYGRRPECLQTNQRIRKLLQGLYRRKGFARLVIDEAQCVLEWGSAFPTDYLALGNLKLQLHRLQIVALTATASPKTMPSV